MVLRGRGELLLCDDIPMRWVGCQFNLFVEGVQLTQSSNNISMQPSADKIKSPLLRMILGFFFAICFTISAFAIFIWIRMLTAHFMGQRIDMSWFSGAHFFLMRDTYWLIMNQVWVVAVAFLVSIWVLIKFRVKK